VSSMHYYASTHSRRDYYDTPSTHTM